MLLVLSCYRIWMSLIAILNSNRDIDEHLFNMAAIFKCKMVVNGNDIVRLYFYDNVL